MAQLRVGRLRLPPQIFDGFSYRRHSFVNESLYLICIAQRQLQCGGRGVYRNGQFTLTRAHNHDGDGRLDDRAEFLNGLYNATVHEFTEPALIFARLSILHDRAARIVNYQDTLRLMRNWRVRRVLPRVDCLEHLFQILSSQEWSPLKNIGNESSLHVFTGNVNTLFEFIAFSCIEILDKIEETAVLSIASTDVVDAGILNVEKIVIFSAIMNNHAFPCMVLCVKNREFADYGPALQYIRRYIRNPHCIYYNFDSVIQQGLYDVYVDFECKPTFYSFANIVYHKAVQLGIATDDVGSRIMMKKIFSLSLLHPNLIFDELQVLRHFARRYQLYGFQELLEYVKNSWVQGVGVEEMSFFNNPNSLNDAQRSTMRIFFNLFNDQRNINIWGLIDCSETIFLRAIRDLGNIQDGHPVLRTPRVRDLLSRRDMITQWRILRQNFNYRPQFVAVCSFWLEDVLLNCQVNNEWVVDDSFVISQNYNIDFNYGRAIHVRYTHEDENVLNELNPNGALHMRHDGAVVINHGQIQQPVVEYVGVQEHIAAARPADVVPGNMVPVAARVLPARVFENMNPEIEEAGNMNPGDGEPDNMNPGVEEAGNMNPGDGEPVNINPENEEAGNMNPENEEADDMNPGDEEADDMNPGDEPVARQPVALNHSRARRLINKINRDSLNITAHGLTCTICFDEALSYIIKPCHHASIGKQCALQLLKNFVEKREAFLLCPYCRTRVTSIDILFITL